MKKRIDILLYEKGLVDSREKARALILAGSVFINNVKVDKPGEKVEQDVEIDIKERLKFVSRGGYKLEKAINYFNINVKDKIALDVGASTGGFTDCLLQNGVKMVYCIDVGYGQLDWKLRNDSRVINLERTNIRYFNKSILNQPIDLIVCDVSFISLKKISEKLFEILKEGGEGVTLIKPQFEAQRNEIAKKGVVKNPDVHKRIIKEIILDFFEKGFSILDTTFSPITGPEGNIEYLLYFSKNQEKFIKQIDIDFIVNQAFNFLKKDN